MSREVDEIILTHSNRGMAELYAAFPEARCQRAARALLALRPGRLFLYTGFFAGGKGETDGPVGAFFLYRGLEKLGWSPLIVTDACCEGYFPQSESLSIASGEDEEPQFRALLEREKPLAHLSIERLGQDDQGRYLNCSGEDVAAVTPKLDRLFVLGGQTVPTIAIGDGGNEVGMGNFADFTAGLGIQPCVIPSDFPIIATVSNWGAYGLLAELQRGSGVPLLPRFFEVKEYLHHLVACGATDGITLKNEMSVDGMGCDVDGEILAQLGRLLAG